MLTFGLVQVKIMVPHEIEVGGTCCLQGIASDALWARVAETGVEVILAGEFGVRTSGVERCGDAKRKPVIGIDVADQVETVAAVEVGAGPLVAGSVLVLGEEADAAGVVEAASQAVLGLSVEPVANATTEGEIEVIGDGPALRFDLLYLAKTCVGTGCWRDGKAVGPTDSVGVA